MSDKSNQLHLSVRENNIKDAEKLIASGADINSMFYGWTPLQLAINQGLEDMAIFLMDNGCNILLYDKNNVSPYEDAVKKKLYKVVEYMLERGVDVNQLLSCGQPAVCVAASNDDSNLLKILIKGKAKVNATNSKGYTPLFIAAKNGYTSSVKVLLDARADCNTKFLESGCQTPLIAAALDDHYDVIKVMLKYDCDINAQDNDGWTALWHAYSNSCDDTMRLLLKSGADKNVINKEGFSILEEAKLRDDDSVTELFQKFAQSWT